MSEIDRVLERFRYALARAKARVEAIEGLIRSFEDAKTKVSAEDLSAMLSSMSPKIEEVFPAPNEQPVEQPAAQRVRGDLTPAEVAHAARDTLLAFGRPLKRGQLVRQMEHRGVPLAGTDKNKNLGTILWRHRQMFVSLPKLGYWPKGVPLPGVYDPETHSETEELLDEVVTSVRRPKDEEHNEGD